MTTPTPTTARTPADRIPAPGTSRTVRRALAALGFAASLVGLQTPAVSALAPPTAGVAYVALAHPVAAPSREVTEVFWYNCPHSYQLEEPLQRWAAQQSPPVLIHHIPAAWPDRADMMGYARLYYALDSLGLADRFAVPVFHAVRDLRIDLTQEDNLREWAGQQNLDPDRLMAAWNSPEVQRETQQAPAERERYQVDEMPSIVVGGTYRTSPFIAPGGVDGTIPVVDYLYQHAPATAPATAPAKTPAKAPAGGAAASHSHHTRGH